MPLLILTTWPALTDPGQQQVVTHELSDHTARLLHKKRSLTAVAINGAPAAWFIGGDRLQNLGGAACRTFALEIRITAGTNTAEEKAAWIAAAWDTMRQAVPGVLAEASYVSIVEIPAGDWGYGGLTQAARSSRPAAPSRPEGNHPRLEPRRGQDQQGIAGVSAMALGR